MEMGGGSRKVSQGLLAMAGWRTTWQPCLQVTETPIVVGPPPQPGLHLGLFRLHPLFSGCWCSARALWPR